MKEILTAEIAGLECQPDGSAAHCAGPRYAGIDFGTDGQRLDAQGFDDRTRRLTTCDYKCLDACICQRPRNDLEGILDQLGRTLDAKC